MHGTAKTLINQKNEEEYENPFVPKVPSSDEHISEQTSILVNIFRLLGVITLIMILWVLIG